MKIVFENRTYNIYNFKSICNISQIGEFDKDPFFDKNLHKIYLIYINSEGKRVVTFLFLSENDFPGVYIEKKENTRPFLIIFDEDFSDICSATNFPQEPLFTLGVPNHLRNKEVAFFKEVLNKIRKP